MFKQFFLVFIILLSVQSGSAVQSTDFYVNSIVFYPTSSSYIYHAENFSQTGNFTASFSSSVLNQTIYYANGSFNAGGSITIILNRSLLPINSLSILNYFFQSTSSNQSLFEYLKVYNTYDNSTSSYSNNTSFLPVTISNLSTITTSSSFAVNDNSKPNYLLITGSILLFLIDILLSILLLRKRNKKI